MLLLIAARSTALPSTRQPITRARALASAAWVGDAYAAELAAAVGAVAEACGVAKALHFLHEGGAGKRCFHRDVKAANVCLTASHVAKLIDCGLAMLVPDNSRTAHTVVTAATSGGGAGRRAT